MSEREAPPIEVEAALIETGIDIAGAFDRKVASWEVRASEEAARHEASEIESQEGYEAAGEARKAVRRARRAIEQERTEFLRPVKAKVSEMEARVREAVSPLKALDEAYETAMGAWEARARREREVMLAAAYAEFAPMLADMCPYGRLRDKFDPDGAWLSGKVSDAKARELMEYAVARVSEGYEDVCMQQCTPEEMADLKTEFFACLDFGEAVRRAAARRRQAESVASFEAERAAQQAPRPEPTFAQKVTEDMAAPAPGEEVPPIAFVAYVTEPQRAGLVAYCKAHGIQGFCRATHGRRMTLVPGEA